MVDGEKLSLEELELALERAAKGEPVELLLPEQDVTEEAVQEQEPTETPQEEAEVPEEPQETAEAEPTPEPEPEQQTDYEKEELKSMLAEYEARAKHWEQVAGRHGGEIGFLKKKLATIETRRPVSTEEDFETDEQKPVQREQPKRGDDSLRTWAVGRAMNEATAAFVQKHSDLGDAAPKVAAYLQKIGYDPQEILLSDDPIAAEKETTRVLEEAYWAVKAEVEAARRAELATRRAEQTAKAAEAKKKAAVSGAGSVPPAKPKAKSPEEMTDKELEAAIQKATGGRW